MKFPVKTVLILVTIITLVAGFFMPRLFFAYQDSSTLSQTEEYEIKPVKLKANVADLADVLLIVARGGNPITVKEGNNLDAYQAEAIAREILADFAELGALDTKEAVLITEAVMPTIIVDEAQGSGSAIVWECVFVIEEPFDAIITLALDDQTEKMVRLVYDQNMFDQEFNEEEFVSRAGEFLRACVDYYPLSGENLKPSFDGNGYVTSNNFLETIGVYAYNNEVGFDITCSAHANRATSIGPEEADSMSENDLANGRYLSYDISFSLSPLEISS